MTSTEDPPRSALDLMNEQVFHVEIVILTTYISVSGLLWKSNWRNYRGGGHVSEGRGLSQNKSFLSGDLLQRHGNTQTCDSAGENILMIFHRAAVSDNQYSSQM